MSRLFSGVLLAACVVLGTSVVSTEQRGGPPRQWWVAKAKPGQYGKHKPHIKLADLKARHQRQRAWMEVVVNDENFHAEYHYRGPGATIATVMHPDTRVFYAVMDGQVRFTLEGQPEPIVATRGSIVNIPRRTPYSAEIIGDAPALWVTAHQQNFKSLYPAIGPKPAATPGTQVIQVGLNVTPPAYTGSNRPHFNLFEAEKEPKFNGRLVVQDDHMWAQAIWGYEKNLPPYNPNDKGHFHVGAAEWWIILEGQIRHNIETVGDFTSSEGDIVYAPASTWHATRFAGPGPSCRLAISAFQFTSLLEQSQ